MRVTKKMLRLSKEYLTKLQNRPTTYFDSNRRCNVGYLTLDKNEAYGGWDLCEVTSDTGAERSLIGNDFGGKGRFTAQQMLNWLNAAIWAIENERTKTRL